MQEIFFLCLKIMLLSCKNPKAFPILRKFLALVCFSKAYFILSWLQRMTKKNKKNRKTLLGAAYWHCNWNIITLCGAAVLVTELFGPKPPVSQFAHRGVLRNSVVFYPSPSWGLCKTAWDTCCRSQGKSIHHEFWKPITKRKRKKKIQNSNPEVPRSVSLFLPGSCQLAELVESSPIQNLPFLFWLYLISSPFLLCLSFSFATQRSIWVTEY